MKRRQAINSILFTCLGLFGSSVIKKDRNHVSNSSYSSITGFKEHIIEISDLIIPRTADSPGARDAGVGDYIIRVLTFCSSKKERKVFLSGLLALEDYSLRKFSRSFLKCGLSQKKSVLDHFGNHRTPSSFIVKKLRRKLFGSTFFEIMKRKTIEGYCTSRLGCVQGLDYDFVPGKYIGCMPYLPSQRSWAAK